MVIWYIEKNWNTKENEVIKLDQRKQDPIRSIMWRVWANVNWVTHIATEWKRYDLSENIMWPPQSTYIDKPWFFPAWVYEETLILFIGVLNWTTCSLNFNALHYGVTTTTLKEIRSIGERVCNNVKKRCATNNNVPSLTSRYWSKNFFVSNKDTQLTLGCLFLWKQTSHTKVLLGE